MLQKIRLQMRQKDDEIKVRRVTNSEVTGKIEKIIVSKKKKGKYNFYIINKKEVREMKIRKLENKRIHTFGSVQFSP